MVICVGQNAYLAYVGVYHVGKRKINKAITAAERYRAHGSHIGKIFYKAIVLIGEN